MKEEVELVQKAQRGERESFGMLYETYLPKIYRFVYLKVSHRGDAEDITHQVFMKAWENIGSFRFQGFPFSSWLYRIAQNAVIDFYRTSKPSLSLEETNESDLGKDDTRETAFDTKEELREIMKAVKKLKPDEQSVVIMRFVDELSNREAALALGKTEGAVRVIQHRALKQLRKHIEHDTS